MSIGREKNPKHSVQTTLGTKFCNSKQTSIMCNSLFAEVSKYIGRTVYNNYVQTLHSTWALVILEGQN